MKRLRVGKLSASGPVYKTTYRFDVIALSGIQKIQFELDSEDGASLRKQSKSGLSTGGIRYRRQTARVEISMLLG
jgi:hypothetical protein